MNQTNIENCAEFIFGCIKQHGKKLSVVNEFKNKFKSWTIQFGDFEITLKEFVGRSMILTSSDHYLNVLKEDGFYKLAGTVLGQVELEKRLIEMLMLFNGNISAKEYANEV